MSPTGLGKIIACFSNFIGHPSVLKVGMQINSFWMILITSKQIILQQLLYLIATKASREQQDNITNVLILRLCRVRDSPLGLGRKSSLSLGNSVCAVRAAAHGEGPWQQPGPHSAQQFLSPWLIGQKILISQLAKIRASAVI